MIRPRGGTTPPRDDEEETMSSAEEIGRLLRDAREERGLDLLAVHDQLNRPITLLEALEEGDLSRLPDQALALSTLRRYAVFLGLDGDAIALRMIDAWSASPHAGAMAADATGIASVTAAVTAGPDHLRAFTQTGQVPRVGAGSTAAPGGYGFGVTPGAPTGTFPVVPKHEIQDSKRAVAKARRRLRAPTPLKVITWVAAFLVAAVVVGFVVYQLRPQWLASARILRVAQPGSPTSRAPASPAATVAPAAPAQTSPGASGPGTPANQVHSDSVVVAGTTTPTSANYTVNAKHFAVTFATSAPVWVQATSSSSPAPLLVGVQPPGTRQSFDANGATLTLQVGASAVVVAVSVKDKGKDKPVFYATPQATPFTYVFAPASN